MMHSGSSIFDPWHKKLNILLTLNSRATPSKILNASSSPPIGRAKKNVV